MSKEICPKFFLIVQSGTIVIVPLQSGTIAIVPLRSGTIAIVPEQ